VCKKEDIEVMKALVERMIDLSKGRRATDLKELSETIETLALIIEHI
jgi:hypothetical protein